MKLQQEEKNPIVARVSFYSRGLGLGDWIIMLQEGVGRRYRGTSPITKRPPPFDPLKTLGKGLL